MICPIKCSCGGKARIRYRMPVTWVECSKKTCKMRTGYYPDRNEQRDPEAERQAVEAWNEMIKKSNIAH